MQPPVTKLTFQSAVPEPLPGQAAMDALDLQLAAGEIWAVRVEPGNEQLPLADAAAGLLPLQAGRVLFKDVDWRQAGADTTLRLRARIGRVFDWHGWVSNLDVIENVTLAQRHHTARPVEEIVAEAQALARDFNLPAVPGGRPAAVPQRDLRRAEWVRAFMGRPELLCLERPGAGVATEHLAALARAANTLCSGGGAVIWISAEDREWQSITGDTVRRFHMRGRAMIPE